MSVSTLESENAQPVAQTQNSELIYRLEDRPPLPQTLFAACQHLLAMFVAVITPALLICQALGLPAQDTQHIISMSLFASGVASIIQIKAWGPVGSGLLSIQGTSFNFVAPLIMGGTALKTGGADVPTMMAALFGTLMLASCTEMVISRVLDFLLTWETSILSMKARRTAASSSCKSVYFFTAAINSLTLVFCRSYYFRSLRKTSAIDFRLLCSSS